MPVPHLRRTSLTSGFLFLSQLTTLQTMSDTHATLGRSSVDDSPGSGEDEIVEPEQGNGIVPAVPPPQNQSLQLTWKRQCSCISFRSSDRAPT
jgi:hypothetical protein